MKIRLSLGFDLRHRDYKSHSLTEPTMLNKYQTFATNKAENRCYEISNTKDRNYSKSATK